MIIHLGCTDQGVHDDSYRENRETIDVVESFSLNPVQREIVRKQVFFSPYGQYNKNNSLFGIEKSFDHYQTRPLRQLFMNNFGELERIGIFIGGPIYKEKRDDVLFVTVLDGCENVIFETRVPIDVQVAKNSVRIIWVPIGIDLNYGEYYYFEVGTKHGGFDGSGGIMTNADNYTYGRMFSSNEYEGFHSLGYPEKKRDIMFVIEGGVSSDQLHMPIPTTNILCEEKCHVLGDEKTEGGPDMYFNVIVQESKESAGGGSFWNREEGLVELKEALDRVLRGTSETVDGGREVGTFATTPPFDEYLDKMNFYLAREDPEQDRGMKRGFFYCANIDARIVVRQNSASYGSFAFSGELSLEDLSFGKGMLQHEVMGHGIANLYEEYCLGKEEAVELSTAFYPNSDTIGCPSWCKGFLSVEELREEMSLSERSSLCWDHDEAECDEHKSLAGSQQCMRIGHLSKETTDYYYPYKCVPRSLVRYNIGLDCEGNSGCFIGVPQGNGIGANRAVPGGSIMGAGVRGVDSVFSGSERMLPVANGFTTPIEEHIRDIMDCMFPVSCDNYPARCVGFVDKWGSQDNDLRTFAELGNGCEGSRNRRR